ncbi:MAG: DUF4381 domain-containing protein [Rhodoferax sp.]|uniref:DUF4381 domain-containing protein n=1 Tax=Rhodoferax sp. TaxID=50421 RepID=UPI003265C76E
MNPGAPPALQLRDIHLPAAPGFWPLAPGWWAAIALLVLLLVGVAVLVWRRHQRKRAGRGVLRELAALEAGFRQAPSPDSLARISMLLRQIALAHFPRQTVSPLSGGDWLRFLDASGGRGRFTEGPGRVLSSLPYQRALPANLDVDALMALVHEWVALNLGRTA